VSYDPRDDEPVKRTPNFRRSNSLCPCDECTADDGAQTTDLEPEDYS
jgi:hypothetical protein